MRSQAGRRTQILNQMATFVAEQLPCAGINQNSLFTVVYDKSIDGGFRIRCHGGFRHALRECFRGNIREQFLERHHHGAIGYRRDFHLSDHHAVIAGCLLIGKSVSECAGAEGKQTEEEECRFHNVFSEGIALIDACPQYPANVIINPIDWSDDDYQRK